MAIAAVPKYLGELKLSSASPGMRFGMFLPLWRQETFLAENNKTKALINSLQLNQRDIETMKALHDRQTELSRRVTSQDQLLILDALSISPFTTGLGNEHPLENGFTFLNPYGLPYFPGSGVKGVLRQAARELASGEWGENFGWKSSTIDLLFGKERTASGDHQRGALIFWDVIPQIKGKTLEVEVMTAHMSHYYQNGESPHESGSPIPINFITIPPDSTFTFFIQCNDKFLAQLPELPPELRETGQWKELLRAAFEHAFSWLGFGAKTSVGYGAMREDSNASEDRAEAARQLDFEQLSDEEQQIRRLEKVFLEETERQELTANGETNAMRKKLLNDALEWDDEKLRTEAAELIKSTLKRLPWSKNMKKSAPRQLVILANQQ